MTILVRGIEDVVYLARLRISPRAEAAVGAPLADRLASVVELVRAGEEGVAFENLCSNLHEYQIRLESTEYAQIAGLGVALQLPASTWDYLAELVFDSPPEGYVEPAVVWSVECRVHSDQSVFQLGAFTSESEAERLRAIRSPVEWGEVYVNMLSVHQSLADWEWDS